MTKSYLVELMKISKNNFWTYDKLLLLAVPIPNTYPSDDVIR